MWAPFIILLLFGGGLSYRVTRFTNIKCNVLNPSYCAFEKCHLKMLGRGIVGLNMRFKLLKGVLNNAKSVFFAKFNGYRPFMFNMTFDFCKFMQKSNTELSFQKIVFDALAKQSNINHTCPFLKELVVDNFVFKEDIFKFLPLPAGEYQLQFIAGTDNIWMSTLSVYALLE
ncbi:uncharacterized protein LOC133844553 [Drosophila sulfurigaster albostrigata]|uniref:uncharacterized protein LOC133844553 n=1 Tax=Drosophila sulfurigaster albostrigata TaxID=89887 RepID=UPI002D21BB03|nr:uncharacterized protein LOC133844553 [Drosophila sulfurigaster albostrigata]